MLVLNRPQNAVASAESFATQPYDLFKPDSGRILIENGRLTDTVSALEMSLAEVKRHAAKELDFLAPRVQEVESRTESLVGKVEKNTLDVDLMVGLVCCHGHPSLSFTIYSIGSEAPKDGN